MHMYAQLHDAVNEKLVMWLALPAPRSLEVHLALVANCNIVLGQLLVSHSNLPVFAGHIASQAAILCTLLSVAALRPPPFSI